MAGLFSNLVIKGIYKNVFAIHIGGSKNKSHISFGGVHSEYKLNTKVPTNYVTVNTVFAWEIQA
jgi:hypothetical protein